MKLNHNIDFIAYLVDKTRMSPIEINSLSEKVFSILVDITSRS